MGFGIEAGIKSGSASSIGSSSSSFSSRSASNSSANDIFAPRFREPHGFEVRKTEDVLNVLQGAEEESHAKKTNVRTSKEYRVRSKNTDEYRGIILYSLPLPPLLKQSGSRGGATGFSVVCVHTDTASAVGGWGTNYTKMLTKFNTGPCKYLFSAYIRYIQRTYRVVEKKNN